MARICFLVFTYLFTLTGLSQTRTIDSLRERLALDMDDTARVNLLLNLAENFYFEVADMDSGGLYGNKAAEMSKKIHWKWGEATGLFYTVGNTFLVKQDYVKCLSDLLYTLTIFENLKDSNYIAKNLAALASVYTMIGEFTEGIFYSRKLYNLAIISRHNEGAYEATSWLGECYFRLGKADSTALYYHQSYQLAKTYKAPDSTLKRGLSYVGLARGAYLTKDYEVAISYLKKAAIFSNLAKSDVINLKGTIQATYGEIFMHLKQWDSALHRFKVSLAISPPGQVGLFDYYFRINMATVYEHINKDSAIKYFKIANDIRTSFDRRMRTGVTYLTQKEVERQNELAEQQEKDKHSRKRNIQYTAIAIGLVTIILLFFLYSRSIVANSKLMSFLGVLILLILFEFINLFIHPYIANFTHDSPFLMLLIMVAIAALLVPAHHRIQRWISTQLVEKNKRIRLAAAKKIIAELEGNG